MARGGPAKTAGLTMLHDFIDSLIRSIFSCSRVLERLNEAMRTATLPKTVATMSAPVSIVAIAMSACAEMGVPARVV